MNRGHSNAYEPAPLDSSKVAENAPSGSTHDVRSDVSARPRLGCAIAFAIAICAFTFILAPWVRTSLAAQRLEQAIGQPWTEAERVAQSSGLSTDLHSRGGMGRDTWLVYRVSAPNTEMRSRASQFAAKVRPVQLRPTVLQWIRPSKLVAVTTTGTVAIVTDY